LKIGIPVTVLSTFFSSLLLLAPHSVVASKTSVITEPPKSKRVKVRPKIRREESNKRTGVTPLDPSWNIALDKDATPAVITFYQDNLHYSWDVKNNRFTIVNLNSDQPKAH